MLALPVVEIYIVGPLLHISFPFVELFSLCLSFFTVVIPCELVLLFLCELKFLSWFTCRTLYYCHYCYCTCCCDARGLYRAIVIIMMHEVSFVRLLLWGCTRFLSCYCYYWHIANAAWQGGICIYICGGVAHAARQGALCQGLIMMICDSLWAFFLFDIVLRYVYLYEFYLVEVVRKHLTCCPFFSLCLLAGMNYVKALVQAYT